MWRDEPVDVYLTDLRRLARLAGVTSDTLLLRAFVVGLPAAVTRELRALPGMERMPLSDVVKRARCLVGELAGSFPAAGLKALPIVTVAVNEKEFQALPDTGCSRTVIAVWTSGTAQRGEKEIVAVDGSRITCAETASVTLKVCGNVITADCVMVNQLLRGVDVVLGMDVLTRLG